MTKEQIEKLIAIGKRKGFNAVQLSQYITQPPYNLCAADASIVYFEARKREPKKITVADVVNASIDTIRPVSDSADAMALAVHAAAGYTPSNLNRSSVKSFALATSTRIRAGKFKRVSPSFVKQVEAELENVIRGIGGPEDSDDTPGEWDFLNRKQISARVFEQLNRFIRKVILRKVRGHPSLGQTLR